jgi:hypothetical protein
VDHFGRGRSVLLCERFDGVRRSWLLRSRPDVLRSRAQLQQLLRPEVLPLEDAQTVPVQEALLQQLQQLLCAGPDLLRSGPEVLRSGCSELLRPGRPDLRRPDELLHARSQVLRSGCPELLRSPRELLQLV